MDHRPGKRRSKCDATRRVSTEAPARAYMQHNPMHNSAPTRTWVWYRRSVSNPKLSITGRKALREGGRAGQGGVVKVRNTSVARRAGGGGPARRSKHSARMQLFIAKAGTASLIVHRCWCVAAAFCLENTKFQGAP